MGKKKPTVQQQPAPQNGSALSMQNMPPEFQQYLQQQQSTPPSAQEIERRRKLFFAKILRATQNPSKAELAQLQTWFPEDWFKELTAKVRETYIFDDQQTATVCVRQIIPYEQVMKILELGQRLLCQSLNVETLMVPGTPFDEFQASLPKQYKDKLPAQFSLDSMQDMNPVELQYNTPQIPLHPHMIVVGDTHGTFEVLENVFAKEGMPSDEIVYLFNGDYVDRGNFSIEVFVSLLLFKILKPRSVFMLRGNHESRSVSEMYSLKEECKQKYPENAEMLFETFLKTFQCLPLAARINDAYYVVHGGISGWKDFDIDMLMQLNRFRDPEQSPFNHFQAFDPLSDVLWSDPTEAIEGVQFNTQRGTSVQFGRAAIKRFLKSSSLKFLIRSHTCVPNGYQLLHDAHTMTLFSVPNYNEKNLGAYCVLYGLYDSQKQPTSQQKKAIKDCTSVQLYEQDPSVPLCFIRQFNCSDHAMVQNQPIIKEMMTKQMQAAMQAQIQEMMKRGNIM